jgi:lipopolysaccharide transport system ATP-binding protein
MSSDLALSVEGLGKRYRLGAIERHDSLRDRLTHAASSLASRLRTRAESASAAAILWAIRGITFDVARGEVLGIIGGNGSGKSTLLKVLSRITTPTEGRAAIRGRVASLLEIGTGFHPDLTGRENIFLNGAILGMTRTEIRRKFDEIVAFAEVERFIDTAVKHYSSGMYVRLAFAVAAHLEPEVLLVDEVLAVGDAQFQKKCVGKLDDVARAGRTVLFVSHNMAAVQRLCTGALVLDHGRAVYAGEPRIAVARYLSSGGRSRYRAAFVSDEPQVIEADVVTSRGLPIEHPVVTDPISVRLRVRLPADSTGPRLGIGVNSADGTPIFTSRLDDVGMTLPGGPREVTVTATIPANTFLAGDYHIVTCVWTESGQILDLQEPALSISLGTGPSVLYQSAASRKGFVQVPCGWEVEAALPEHAAR